MFGRMRNRQHRLALNQNGEAPVFCLRNENMRSEESLQSRTRKACQQGVGKRQGFCRRQSSLMVNEANQGAGNQMRNRQRRRMRGCCSFNDALTTQMI